MRSPLTPALASRWHRDGWCVIEDAIPADDLAAAQEAVGLLFPTAEEMEGAAADDQRAEPWRTWDAAWPEFPFHSTRLNRLVLHEVVLDVAAGLLGRDDVRLYLALATAKYRGQSSGYNQLLHADYPNHSLVVPRDSAGYEQVETFIYLNDVSPRNGATRLVSLTETADIPVEQHTLNLEEHRHLYDDPADASGPAGSIVAYRPDVYHRSVDITEPGQARFMLHVAFKPTGLDWVGYQAWPFKGFSPQWHKFVAQATVRQLVAVGFPPPGDPYWTTRTLAGVAARYPGLDTTPWREAL